MNRFRQLKQKLINSKRDSQKLQQLQNDKIQIQLWLQKQLQYYGINKDSYRLRELSNKFFTDKQNDQENVSQQNWKSKLNDIVNQERRFSKKDKSVYNDKQNICVTNDLSFGNQQLNKKYINRQAANPQNPNISKIICKKNRIVQRQHVCSMNDAQKMLQKNIQKFRHQQSNQFRSEQFQTSISNQQDQIMQTPIQKQLDYYTLILQLTAQLNYSRLNKQTSNQKSILKQIKNLIQYIEGESASTGAPASKNSNKKSTHTFSSVFSNQSLANEQQNQNMSQKRKIKYKLISQPSSSKSNKKQSIQNYSQNNYQQQQNQQQEHDRTFGSVNGFEQEQKQQQINTSIIDLVNNNNDQQRQSQHIHNSQNKQNSMIQNSPLSKITEHESQYTDSMNPSLNVSPNRKQNNQNTTPDKLMKFRSFVQQNFHKKFIQHQLQQEYSQTKFKKQISKTKSQEKCCNENFNLLPENQFILKRLSDKFDKTQQTHNLMEQSLQYKKILYMLDSQMANSDHKNRTFSSLFGGKSQSSSQPRNSVQLKNIKNMEKLNFYGESDSSAKSFIKQIFESNQELQNKEKHFIDKKGCLMKNLQSLFHNQCQQHQRTHQSKCHDKVHKRSATSQQAYFTKQTMNKTGKYGFNFLSNLSNQVQQQLLDTQYFDNQKYQSIRTQYYQDQSIYHKVSRNSYLTSGGQNCNSKTFQTSSQSQNIREMKQVNYKSKQSKGGLIVKKKNKPIVQKKQKSVSLIQQQIYKQKQNRIPHPEMKFIVKKKKLTESSNNQQSNRQQQSGNIYSESCISSLSQISSEQPKKGQTIIRNIKGIKQSQNQSNHRNNSKDNRSYNQKSSSLLQPQSEYKLSDFQLNSHPHSVSRSTLQNANHNKSSSSSQKSNFSKKSINSHQSKSSNRSSKHNIKYKIYEGNKNFLTKVNAISGGGNCSNNLNVNAIGQQKEDKRKVLKDIVSLLNSKYNKKIGVTN